jgi:hypothetical protein
MGKSILWHERIEIITKHKKVRYLWLMKPVHFVIF